MRNWAATEFSEELRTDIGLVGSFDNEVRNVSIMSSDLYKRAGQDCLYKLKTVGQCGPIPKFTLPFVYVRKPHKVV
ncbi:unnamed protein product [Sphenostylis stenocarpa]|uniref:Uncharacterized protein n=1 Tax=Sphenostylis stenocarpa TaxID=92480 RepID=A0AA86S050_9FABA|nr:unnamed protein product [Sphenostylis stenocarpa]